MNFILILGDNVSEVAVTTVSERGQVVIPKEIRAELGLEKNAGIAMKTVDGKLVMTKIRLSDKDFELKESFVKKMKKREKSHGIPVDSFAKRYGLE
jgi:AbrB family looped-hinge helix DNA binding protein